MVLQFSDYVAIVTVRSKLPSSSRVFSENILPPFSPSPASAASSPLVKLRLNPLIRARPKRSGVQIASPSASEGHKLVPKNEFSPLSDSSVDSTTAPVASSQIKSISSGQFHNHRPDESMICSLAEAQPYPYLASSRGPSLDENLAANKIAKRELAPQNGVLMNLNEKEWHSFQLIRLVKSDSPETTQLLTNGSFYTEVLTTCKPNLEIGKEYAIWGKVQDGQILVTLCNSVQLTNMTQDDKEALGVVPKLEKKDKVEDEKNQ